MRRTFSRLLLHPIVLGAAALTGSGCAQTGAGPGLESGDGVVHGLGADSVSVDGQEREFSYFVPESTEAAQLPIVIYLHGHGDNMRHILGRGLMASASSVWMEVAEREQFLVLYPLGAKGPGRRGKSGWNDCRSDAEGNPEMDDVAFLRRLIGFATASLHGDPKRVYVTGMSNGGHMAMRAAMEMSTELAAVASVVALLPREITACSPPTQPVPILMMHGTEDPLAPFHGGTMAGGRGEVLSARETVDAWVEWNELKDVMVETVEVPDYDRGDDSRIIQRVRERSPGGVAVVAIEMQGAGHTEPSRSAKMGRLLTRIQGNQNRDIEMAETIWEFFESRSRPTSGRSDR